MPDNTTGNAYPRTGRYVAPIDDRDNAIAAERAGQAMPEDAPPAGLWRSAWRDLRRRPLFWVSAAIIVLVVLVAAFPGLFTSTDPTEADLVRSLDPASPGHPMGFTQQGYDVYSRVIYGARASVITGIGVTLLVTLFGVIIGSIAGFLGGWFDTILSRITDVFFAIPLILAGIVLMQLFTDRTTGSVVLVLAAFGWPQMARVVRGAVMSVKNEEYVTASRALGLSQFGILVKHVLPNCLAPVIVMATTSLGIYIVAEATLSYLGIGLPPTTVSWGNDISVAQQVLRQAPHNLFWPAAALALTVLGFILMGDALKDSLDPKERRR
ncbi:ABC transporter permease [Corynebacterium sp. TAE3-ERU12]|uniref:ABC transporter permease n=1 Tax=Corynebacterium sp. TAE3-ERU12 TaxID=2849491 RepID=UPI001C43A5E6|nr:ABC transporter permease [Corynebacterium sp. TAE3-ERU12]MBV7294698.1 ABC transporter permease [Corynebacterium sp. TAE3-ERU12]